MINPFSPIYFIKENKSRCTILIFLIFITYASFLGGLYVTNSEDSFKYSIECLKDYLIVMDTHNDVDGEVYYKLAEEIKENKELEYIQLGYGNVVYINSIMGFEMDPLQYTFTSKESFKIFNESKNIVKDIELKDGEVLLSKKMADNLGLSIGEIISYDNEEIRNNLSKDFKIVGFTNEDSYTAYFMDYEATGNIFMILNKEMTENDFSKFSSELNEEYKDTLNLYTNVTFYEKISEEFRFLYILYVFIVLLMAFVLAITINSAFIGVYQKRNFEFAVYRAIGISKIKVYKKIIYEILLLDFLGLIFGGIIFFVGLYLLNNIYLYDIGQYLCYYNPIALLGLILCNISILIPVIISRCRNLSRANICEY